MSWQEHTQYCIGRLPQSGPATSAVDLLAAARGKSLPRKGEMRLEKRFGAFGNATN